MRFRAPCPFPVCRKICIRLPVYTHRPPARTDFGLFAQPGGRYQKSSQVDLLSPTCGRSLLLESLMSKNRLGKRSISIKAFLLTVFVVPLAGCATSVQTPGGEVICYSQNCVRDMQAWTRDEYLARQYEQEYGSRVETRSPEPAAPVAPPVRYRRPTPAPTPITCPRDMIPAPPPDYGCVYPRR